MMKIPLQIITLIIVSIILVSVVIAKNNCHQQFNACLSRCGNTVSAEDQRCRERCIVEMSSCQLQEGTRKLNE